MSGFIDTHHHYLPSQYLATLAREGTSDSGGRAFPSWSPQEAVDFIDERNIESAVLSLSAPGVWRGEATEARALARLVNEAAADLARDQPGRFGFFATLPLPSIDDALEELRFAFDELGADGVVLLANVDGIYLGDRRLDPVMAELDRRGAVVFVHPNELPGPTSGLNIPPWAVDFLLDTTRAAVNMVAEGTLTRFPHMRVILSHAGGFLPYVAGRVGSAGYAFSERMSGKEVIAQLQSFYFDTALSSTRFSLPTLLEFAHPDRILFGSDWPFAQGRTVDHFVSQLDAFDTDGSLRQRMHATAQSLFPRFVARA